MMGFEGASVDLMWWVSSILRLFGGGGGVGLRSFRAAALDFVLEDADVDVDMDVDVGAEECSTTTA